LKTRINTSEDSNELILVKNMDKSLAETARCGCFKHEADMPKKKQQIKKNTTQPLNKVSKAPM